MEKVYVVYYKVYKNPEDCDFKIETIETEVFKNQDKAANRAGEVSSDLIGINECEVK